MPEACAEFYGAGKHLHFDVEVVSVRDATQKELDEGLHGEYLPLEEEEEHEREL